MHKKYTDEQEKGTRPHPLIYLQNIATNNLYKSSWPCGFGIFFFLFFPQFSDPSDPSTVQVEIIITCADPENFLLGGGGGSKFPEGV